MACDVWPGSPKYSIQQQQKCIFIHFRQKKMYLISLLLIDWREKKCRKKCLVSIRAMASPAAIHKWNLITAPFSVTKLHKIPKQPLSANAIRVDDTKYAMLLNVDDQQNTNDNLSQFAGCHNFDLMNSLSAYNDR